MICRNCGKSFEGDVCPDCGTPADGTEQANAPAEAQTDGAEVAVKNTKVCGRYFAYRIAAAAVLFIASFALAMYAATGEKTQAVAMVGTIPTLLMWVSVAVSALIMVLAAASVKRPVSRRLLNTLFVLDEVAFVLSNFFGIVMSGVGAAGQPDIFKIVLFVVTFVLAQRCCARVLARRTPNLLRP